MEKAARGSSSSSDPNKLLPVKMHATGRNRSNRGIASISSADVRRLIDQIGRAASE